MQPPQTASDIGGQVDLFACYYCYCYILPLPPSMDKSSAQSLDGNQLHHHPLFLFLFYFISFFFLQRFASRQDGNQDSVSPVTRGVHSDWAAPDRRQHRVQLGNGACLCPLRIGYSQTGSEWAHSGVRGDFFLLVFFFFY